MINKGKTMNSVELLKSKLSEMGVTRFNVFPIGNAAPESAARAVLAAIEQVEAGNFEDVGVDDD
jgi:hypothetical protein